MVDKAVLAPVENIKARAQCTNPKLIVRVFENRPYLVTCNRVNIFGVVEIPHKPLAIEIVQSAHVGTNPKPAGMVNAQINNYIVAEAVGVRSTVFVCFEAVFLPVEIDKPATIRSNPEITKPVFSKTVNIFIIEPVLLKRMLAVCLEFEQIGMIKAYSFLISSNPNDV